MRNSCYIAGQCGDFRAPDERDTTEFSKSCQPLFAEKVKPVKAAAFGSRLLQAFNGSTKAEIARALGVGASTVSDYIRGSSKPTAEGLIRIAEITQCNLHWLLTGEGDVSADPLRFLSPGVKTIVEKLARDEKRPAAEIVTTLVSDALVSRGAELFGLHTNLRERELEQLRIIFNEFYMPADESAATLTKSSAPSKRQAS